MIRPLEAPSGSFATAGSPSPVTSPSSRPRLDSIDLLRGVVMVLMALDHVRDFLGHSGHNPRDLTQPAVFLTRWITHFCAPTFVFLAGISAFLYGTRGRAPAEVSRFLATRGAWLVVLELTVVRWGWTFSLTRDFFPLGVIWVIGCSMIVLAALVHLPRWAIAAFAVSMVLGHNLLDGFQPSRFGTWGWAWNVVHVMGWLEPLPGTRVLVVYPLVPWVGLLAAGYAFGPIMLLPGDRRRRWGITLGLGAVALFVVLRSTGLYGDPAPWAGRDHWLSSVLAFVDCEKYPPSLLFLCMTLAPALLALGFVERVSGRLGSVFVTFGRVPMLYYVVHIYAAHAIALVYVLVTAGDAAWLLGGTSILSKPTDYGLGLPGVYLVWLGLVLALYPLCRWFAALKQHRKDWWLSYL